MQFEKKCTSSFPEQIGLMSQPEEEGKSITFKDLVGLREDWTLPKMQERVVWEGQYKTGVKAQQRVFRDFLNKKSRTFQLEKTSHLRKYQGYLFGKKDVRKKGGTARNLGNKHFGRTTFQE